MDRRDFLFKTGTALGAASLGPGAISCGIPGGNVSEVPGRYLNAYYFRAHMYTIVPKQVQRDLQYMADLGTDAVSIAILEQDLFAAVENVNIIANEAEKLGMALQIVPSRWGGILAGAPKVPSLFSAQNPKTWVLDAKGKVVPNRWSGVMSSIHYDETRQFFKDSLDKCFDLWPVKGVIWDEPKLYTTVDYSAAAKKKLNGDPSISAHQNAFSDFFSEINAHIKAISPRVKTSLFVYANLGNDVIESASKITDLDYFGCDGRPWRNEDGGEQEQTNKVLLGAGERFITAARDQGKGAFWLIENHNMSSVNNELMDKRLGEVIAFKPEQLAYYYFPRNVDQPSENMSIIAKHIKKYKS